MIAIARRRAKLTLRELAARAGTSHATLSAYERGRVTPTVDTAERIVRAAGFHVERRLVPAPDPQERAAELAAVLELAEQFPASVADRLDAPVFGR